MSAKSKGIIIGYSIIIIISIIVAIINGIIIIKIDIFDNDVIFEAIPIYLGIISFFIKYIMDTIQHENESRQYWYRNYILEKNLKSYLEYFDKSKKMFEEILKIKGEILKNNPNINAYKIQTNTKFSPIVNDFNIKKGELTASLNFIKVYNPNLCQILSKIFADLQDEFTKAVDDEGINIKIKDKGELNTKLEELKNEMLKEFYNNLL